MVKNPLNGANFLASWRPYGYVFAVLVVSIVILMGANLLIYGFAAAYMGDIPTPGMKFSRSTRHGVRWTVFYISQHVLQARQEAKHNA